jgi:outer membrane protein OmpA-like peptidoglycan-associated protein
MRIKSIDLDYLNNSDDFNDILTLKYIRYSDVLSEYHDYRSAEHFAKLAMRSHKRKNEVSFNIDDYMFQQDPNMLADIHFLFNCWFYFETKNKNLGEASICKDTFNKIMTFAEKKRKESLEEKTVVVDKKQEKFLTKEEEIYFLNILKKKTVDIEFDFDSYKLNPQAVVKISALLKYLNGLKSDYKITIIGHTDRVGKSVYNNTLARRRATTVYNILNKNGVPKNLIHMEAMSSKSPQIVTKRDDKMQTNRRVEIIINTDYKTQDFNPQPVQ